MSEELNINSLEEVVGGYRKQGHIRIINCQHACNVRAKASGNSDIIGHAYAGRRYSFYGWSGNWARISYEGRIAYVYTDFVLVLD